MRIITGIYKSRVLKAPKDIRPTEDRVRKALFDILGDIEGLSFLELYAGSGAVGLEAISRGVKTVVFVEKEGNAARVIQDNLAGLGLNPHSEQAFVINKDALSLIPELARNKKSFNLIFLDPPYHGEGDSESLIKKTLQTICAYDILAPYGFVVAQHFKKDKLPDQSETLKLIKEAAYGDTVLSFYSHVPNCHISRNI